MQSRQLLAGLAAVGLSTFVFAAQDVPAVIRETLNKRYPAVQVLDVRPPDDFAGSARSRSGPRSIRVFSECMRVSL